MYYANYTYEYRRLFIIIDIFELIEREIRKGGNDKMRSDNFENTSKWNNEEERKQKEREREREREREWERARERQIDRKRERERGREGEKYSEPETKKLKKRGKKDIEGGREKERNKQL